MAAVALFPKPEKSEVRQSKVTLKEQRCLLHFDEKQLSWGANREIAHLKHDS